MKTYNRRQLLAVLVSMAMAAWHSNAQATLVYSYQFGGQSFGRVLGKFIGPTDVAVDVSGNIFVTDGTAVQKFSNGGTPLLFFGSNGSNPGQFNSAFGIATRGSNVLVVDEALSRVQTFDLSGNYVSVFGSRGTGSGQFLGPKGIAIDTPGNIFVVDSGGNRVEKFSSDGTFVSGSIGGSGGFNNAYLNATDSFGNVFVVDSGNNRIQKLSNDGTFLGTFGSFGSGNGQFNAPGGIAIDALGSVFVSDIGNNRIQEFSNSGTFISTFGTPGSGDGQLSGPSGLDFDASGKLFVVDANNYRIQVFTVPEPAGMALVAIGVLALAALDGRRSRVRPSTAPPSRSSSVTGRIASCDHTHTSPQKQNNGR